MRIQQATIDTFTHKFFDTFANNKKNRHLVSNLGVVRRPLCFLLIQVNAVQTVCADACALNPQLQAPSMPPASSSYGISAVSPTALRVPPYHPPTATLNLH